MKTRFGQGSFKMGSTGSPSEEKMRLFLNPEGKRTGFVQNEILWWLAGQSGNDPAGGVCRWRGTELILPEEGQGLIPAGEWSKIG